MNKIVHQDIMSIVQRIPDVDYLKNKTIMITGATGFLGSLLVDVIVLLNELHHTQTKVVALVRNREKFELRFPNGLPDGVSVQIQDIRMPIAAISEKIDILVHAASNTNSSSFIDAPLETFDILYTGTRHVAQLGLDIGAEIVINLSSMEAYGKQLDASILDENSLSVLDPRNLRSTYQLGKCISEFVINTYAQVNADTSNTRFINARLSQIIGSGVDLTSRKIMNVIADAVINGTDIALATPGDSVSTYCSSIDALVALFYIMRYGQSGETYNIANTDTACSIKEMAKNILSEFGDSDLMVVTKSTQDEKYPPSSKLILSNKRLIDLGWNPEYDLRDMYARLIAYIREETHEH